MVGELAPTPVSAHVTIRPIVAPTELVGVNALFQQIWGTSEPIVQVDLLRAIGYTGGYVAGAYDTGPNGEHLVGASFGFLADHDGERALHSHITGILPGVQHAGVGRALKDHQRAWAAERGIAWITWTFDPLVRRNAWFNIEVLGAHVAEYVVDFYGEMHDSVNTGMASDRLVMAWPTSERIERIERIEPGTLRSGVEVPTPDDIVVLRRTDPTAADEWRLRLRSELGDRLTAGARVTGFTRAGAYVLTDVAGGPA
ncbi:MAG TPA: hypothetical protein VNQ73_00635 [Ilumatobacter sp.]|nr:hypothetical protein [Ilumatobacter sp.]